MEVNATLIPTHAISLEKHFCLHLQHFTKTHTLQIHGGTGSTDSGSPSRQDSSSGEHESQSDIFIFIRTYIVDQLMAPTEQCCQHSI